MNEAAVKWRLCFANLNRGEPGIVGLLEFSEVSDPSWCRQEPLLRIHACLRHGPLRRSI